MNFEKLNDISCRIDNIQNNDKIPIGGSSFGKLNVEVIADIEKFEMFFQKVEKNAKKSQNNTSMIKWLSQNASGFEAEIFMHMCAYDNILRKMYPDFCSNISNRQKFYDSGKEHKLSEAFECGICQCAEIAILAQAYLQRQGLNTKYFEGELLYSADDEFGERHSFITFKTPQGNDYFYDPATPHNTSVAGFCLPRISSFEATPDQKQQFENRIHSSSKELNCAFLEAKDIITQSKLYYGYGNGANILPSYIISKNNIQTPIIKENVLQK